jgi:hypothetical protein
MASSLSIVTYNIQHGRGMDGLDRNLLFPDQYSTKLKTMVRHA